MIYHMCRDNDLPVRVYDMGIKGALLDIVEGKNVGTLIGWVNHARRNIRRYKTENAKNNWCF